MITIRLASLSDAAAITRLNLEDLGYDYPEALTRAKLEKVLKNDAFRVWVAEMDGEVVGYLQAEDYDTLYEAHMKNIHALAVRQAYRGKGVGKALLAQAEAWARAAGAAAVRLVSRISRTEAHAFYEHCGYTAEKVQKNFKKRFES